MITSVFVWESTREIQKKSLPQNGEKMKQTENKQHNWKLKQNKQKSKNKTRWKKEER